MFIKSKSMEDEMNTVNELTNNLEFSDESSSESDLEELEKLQSHCLRALKKDIKVVCNIYKRNYAKCMSEGKKTCYGFVISDIDEYESESNMYVVNDTDRKQFLADQDDKGTTHEKMYIPNITVSMIYSLDKKYTNNKHYHQTMKVVELLFLEQGIKTERGENYYQLMDIMSCKPEVDQLAITLKTLSEKKIANIFIDPIALFILEKLEFLHEYHSIKHLSIKPNIFSPTLFKKGTIAATIHGDKASYYIRNFLILNKNMYSEIFLKNLQKNSKYIINYDFKTNIHDIFEKPKETEI